MLRAHRNSKSKAEQLSKILWGIGIENHIGYDKKPFSPFTRNGWAYRYVVRIRLNAKLRIYAEFKGDWNDSKGLFEKVSIYNTNGKSMTQSNIRSAFSKMQKIIGKIYTSAQKIGEELFTHPPYIEYPN